MSQNRSDDAAYFQVKEDGNVNFITYSNTVGADDVYEEAPDKLARYTLTQNQLSKALKENSTTILMYLGILKELTPKGSLRGNYFGWKQAKNGSDEYNKAVRTIRLRWKALNDIGVPKAIQSYEESQIFKTYNGKKCVEARPIKLYLKSDFFSYEAHGDFEDI